MNTVDFILSTLSKIGEGSNSQTASPITYVALRAP